LVSSSEIARLGRAASQLGAVKAVEKSRNGMARKRRALERIGIVIFHNNGEKRGKAESSDCNEAIDNTKLKKE
jgi:hypothetical protein